MYGYLGTHGIPIAFRTLELEPKPMKRGSRLIVQENRGLAAVVDRQIHAAVVIVVATSKSSAYVRFAKIGTGQGRDLAKPAPSVIQKQLCSLAKRDVGISLLVHIA